MIRETGGVLGVSKRAIVYASSFERGNEDQANASLQMNSGDWILVTTFLRVCVGHIWAIPRVSLTGENVYVTHHSATAASPAVMGLLNLINSSEALEHFQRERGQDPLAPNYGHAKITPRSAYGRLGPGVICAAALLVSFWFGGSAAWLASAWKARRRTDGRTGKA